MPQVLPPAAPNSPLRISFRNVIGTLSGRYRDVIGTLSGCFRDELNPYSSRNVIDNFSIDSRKVFGWNFARRIAWRSLKEPRGE